MLANQRNAVAVVITNMGFPVFSETPLFDKIFPLSNYRLQDGLPNIVEGVSHA